MRVLAVLIVVALSLANAIEISRPVLLRSKLQARRTRLGDSVVGAAEQETLEHLRVAAAEREGDSLADQFAMDLASHVAAKSAAKAEAEATAGLDSEETVVAEIVSDSEAQVEVTQAVEAVSESSEGLSMATLQELEYTKTSVYAPKVAVKAAVAAALKRVALKTDEMRTGSCQLTNDKAAGVSTLKHISLRAAPPVRDQSFVVEIDGAYKGPDVTYGSVTIQIARVSSTESQAKDMPELAYRHSIVLSDVVQPNPFRVSDPLSVTLYVPEESFNMYAPSGEYKLTVVMTQQDKLPFACAQIDFRLA